MRLHSAVVVVAVVFGNIVAFFVRTPRMRPAGVPAVVVAAETAVVVLVLAALPVVVGPVAVVVAVVVGGCLSPSSGISFCS